MAGSWLAASLNNNVLGGDGDDDDDGWMDGSLCPAASVCAPRRLIT